MDEKYADENGEIYRPFTVLKRDNEIVKVFDPAESGGRNAKFVKVNTGRKAKRRMRGLTNPEAGFLLKIMLYADQRTNMLVGDGERGKKHVPLTVMDLYEIAGTNRVTGKQIYESLKKKNVIIVASGEGIQKALFLNPDYGINGKKALPAIVEMFRNAVDIESLLPPADKEEE